MSPVSLIPLAVLVGISATLGLLWRRYLLQRYGADSDRYRNYVAYNRFVLRLWLVAVPVFVLAVVLTSAAGC